MKRILRSFFPVLLLACMLLFLTTPSSYALLTSDPQPLVNSLTPDTNEPDIKIVEDLTEGKKVQIRNTGNKAVKVRVYLSVYYQSDTDPKAILPANGFVYDKPENSAWIWNGNGATWPYVLEPGELTGVLINNVTAPAAPEGYHLEVQVIAQNMPAY